MILYPPDGWKQIVIMRGSTQWIRSCTPRSIVKGVYTPALVEMHRMFIAPLLVIQTTRNTQMYPQGHGTVDCEISTSGTQVVVAR